MERKSAVILLSLLLAACPVPEPATAASGGFTPVGLLPGVMEELATLRTTDNDARRAALVALLEARGFEPELHAFPNDGRAGGGLGGDPRETGHNIVVTIGDGERDLVIGAHFDAVPAGEGMIDNAASALVLVRAAEALRRRPPAGHRVHVVLFDMEEIGLVGSRHYAATLDPERVTAMINLDVNGYGDTLFYGHTSHGHGWLYAALRRACGAQDLRCVDFATYPPTDNLSFQRAGIPNVSLSVLPQAEVHQLWLMMNEREDSGLAEGFLPGVFLTIHTRGDTFARIEPDAMTLAYNALLGLLAELE